MADLSDYLDLTVALAREQIRALTLHVPGHGRQVAFLRPESLLSLAASFLIKRRFVARCTIMIRVPGSAQLEAWT